MHIYFSGIGGAGIGPLAQIAYQAGYKVSGSDKQDSSYIRYLKKHGVTNIHIGQTKDDIAKIHNETPIDWMVYSSALTLENPNAPELEFCKSQNIKTSKRDELLSQILKEKQLNLIAVAGTHGKTTTTALAIWLFKKLGLPISYSVGAKISFGDMGQYDEKSKYFVYEADEFDRNFLAFNPYMSLITGVSWDHHEMFPTRKDYQKAFKEFIGQSKHTIVWQEDADYLSLVSGSNIAVQNPAELEQSGLTLDGLYNRLDAWLTVQALHKITKEPIDGLVKIANEFPTLSRRMEPIIPNLYSDYAHTPEKIRGCMSVAQEISSRTNQNIVVVYEPLTNRRQHYMKNDYKDCFEGASELIWIPSYLAREDPSQRVIAPQELIEHLSDPSFAKAMERDSNLKTAIQKHLDAGDMIVCMAGGGGGSLDDWLREEFIN